MTLTSTSLLFSGGLYKVACDPATAQYFSGTHAAKALLRINVGDGLDSVAVAAHYQNASPG